MKYFKYFIMMAAAVFTVASCKTNGYNFEKVAKADVQYVAANYPDGVFFESEVVLNDTLDQARKVYPKAICNVFQSRDTVIMILHSRDTLGGKPVVTVIPHAHMMEDSPMEYPVEYSFNDAVNLLWKADCHQPHSDKMTLRRPFGPNPNNNPQYIFGSKTDTTYIYVNANTGAVTENYDYEIDPSADTLTDWIGNLDHDIYVGNVSCIEDAQHTGFDTWVGPTGWPWTDPVMWETALYEDKDFYYARLIYHEYMLWWSWDYPYIAVKFPKCNVSGDLRTDEKLRYQVLWDITYTTERSYNYKPYITDPVVRHINGHTVTFGSYACRYEKYYVISDSKYNW